MVRHLESALERTSQFAEKAERFECDLLLPLKPSQHAEIADE